MFTVKHYYCGKEDVFSVDAATYYGPLADEETRDVRVVVYGVEHDTSVSLREGRVTVLNDNGAEVAEYDLGHAVTVGDEPDAAAFHWPPCGITGVLHDLATEGAPV